MRSKPGKILLSLIILICMLIPYTALTQITPRISDVDNIFDVDSVLYVDTTSYVDSVRNVDEVLAVDTILITDEGISPVKADDRHLFTPENVFLSLPENVLPLLPVNTRMDMIDYIHADTVRMVRNKLGGQSALLRLTPDYLKARITDVSTLEIKIIGEGKKGVAIVNYVIATPDMAGDSELFIYNRDMKPLKLSKYFKIPITKDFITIPSEAAMTETEACDMIPFPTIEYALSETENTLSATLTVGKYLTRENMAILKPYLHSELKYRWDKNKFIKIP